MFQFSFKTASEILALQIQRAFSKFNIFMHISKTMRETTIRGKSYGTSAIFQIQTCSYNKELTDLFGIQFTPKSPWIIHNYYEDASNFYLPIKKMTDELFLGDVYNLHTENNEYLISNAVVHNCGGLIATVNNNGVKGSGLEFSQFAIDNAILDAKKYLTKCDLAQIPWPIEQHDWVLMIDVMEHIFQDDVDKVIAEAKKKAKKYIVAKICTAQLPREVWSAKKADYEEVVAQAKREGFEWLIASGHVTCQAQKFWINKFVDSNWVLREDLSEKLRKELHLPEDWRTTLILENVAQKNVEAKSELPTTFTSQYYDENYFAIPKGKKYCRNAGLLDGWSYANPTGEYLGCKDIAKAWKTIFSPTKMLDAFTGRGTFVAYCRDLGIEAVGFDFSEYAVKNPYPRCKPEWLQQHDATKPWPYPDKSFDFVTILDAFEHLYMEDIPFVVKELHRVASKYIFIQTAIAGSGGLQGEGKEYILEKNKPVPLEIERYAVAGHVTLLSESKWETLLEDDDWMRRRDLETWFKALTPKDTIKNWVLNSIIIFERA